MFETKLQKSVKKERGLAGPLWRYIWTQSQNSLHWSAACGLFVWLEVHLCVFLLIRDSLLGRFCLLLFCFVLLSPSYSFLFTSCSPLVCLKAVVHPKIKVIWKCAHLQAIRDVEEFVSSSLVHQCFLCSEWVPSEWESKQLIKTSQ